LHFIFKAPDEKIKKGARQTENRKNEKIKIECTKRQEESQKKEDIEIPSIEGKQP
jgi:hypothetical protein